MKIYEAGEGIFRTHVTWEELELQFQELFGKEARFGENKKVTNIGDGRIKNFPELVNMDSFVNIGEELGIPKILAHGDMWSTNILWRKKDDGMSLAAVLDFQTAHLGMPATDLVRILGASLQGKERQEKWESLVEVFYDYLLEELNGQPAPYTLEQVKECYRRFFPLGGFMLVPMIGPLFEFNNNNITDEEQRAKITELILEKSKCLLDDILENHERNKQIKEKN